MKISQILRYQTLCILYLMFSLVSFSQDAEKKTGSKTAVGFILSPNYAYRVLNYGSDSTIKALGARRDSTEIPRLGYTVGLSFIHNLSNRITIETGIFYSNLGDKTKPVTLTYATPDPAAPTEIRLTDHFHYIDIPLKGNFVLLNGRTRMFLSAGAAANIFLGYSTTAILIYEDDSRERSRSTGNPGFNKLNYSAILGLGVHYSFSTKLEGRLEPIGTYNLRSIISAPIEQYLYSVGLNVGIYYRL